MVCGRGLTMGVRKADVVTVPKAWAEIDTGMTVLGVGMDV